MARKERTGRQVIAATKRAIDNRVGSKGPRAGATKRELRDSLQHTMHPVELTHALEIAGLHMHTATADELHDLIYGIAWARAYKRPLREYFATAWGVDQGQMAFAA